MIKSIFLVFLGGGFGSALRYLISKATFSVYSGSFPLGTLISNVISCLVLAFLLYVFNMKTEQLEKVISLTFIIGFCGGLSTFSTFSYETFSLIKDGFMGFAIANILISLSVGILSIYLIFLSSAK